MKSFTLLFSAILFATSSYASEKILCSELEPDWMPIFEGSLLAESVGRVVLIDLDQHQITQLPSSAINSFEARVEGYGDIVIHGLYTSGTKNPEMLLSTTKSFSPSAGMSAIYELGYDFTFSERGGYKGQLSIQLYGESLTAMGSGSGYWSNEFGNQGKFEFCTSTVGNL